MPALETAAVATSVGTHAVSTITAAGASVASAIRALGKVVARTCWSAYGRGIGLIALKMRRWSSRCVTILWVLRWELTVFVLAAGDDETSGFGTHFWGENCCCPPQLPLLPPYGDWAGGVPWNDEFGVPWPEDCVP